MGDEVRDPRRTIPRSVALGGTLCALMYVGCVLALLTAVPQSQMAVVQGLLQAVDTMSASFGIGWILLPLAVLMAASIAGSTSAWVSGSARILFVCGLDRYLPKALGKVHPRHHSPHVALIMFGFLATAIIAMSFIGASVQEAYLTMLDLAVALQMISYIYLFLSLLKRAFSKSSEPRYFRRPVLQLASVSGLAMATLGFSMAFVPSRQISSMGSFELKMFLTLGFILALASGLFFYYSRLRPERRSTSGACSILSRGRNQLSQRLWNRGPIGARIGRRIIHPGFRVVQNRLAAAHGLHVFAPDSDLVAALGQLLQRRCGHARFDVDIAARARCS